MLSRTWIVAALIVVAGIAFWLAAAGPEHVLRIDAGNVGTVVLLSCLWWSLWWLSHVSVGTLESTASPAEWQAWIGLVFLGFAIAYFAIKLPLFAVGGPITDHPDAARAGRNGVMLLVGWLVLSSVLGRRWRGKVQEDERDREISARACAAGRGVLVAALFVVAVTLGFSPPDRLTWITPMLLAQLLILLTMLSHWFEMAVQAASYRRDRR